MFWPRDLIARETPAGDAAAAPSAALDRAMAAYLGLAIGDALGATVEFMTPREIIARHGLHRDIVGGGWLRLKPGRVTDDTTMSLALGDAILANGRVEALAAATAFDRWMRAKPVDIGNTVRRNLIHFRNTGLPEAPPSEHDAGNGAAMRVLPVALACFGHAEQAVRAASAAQAHVTHHNPLSDAACETLIRMVQALLAGADAMALEQQLVTPLCAAFPPFACGHRRRENPGGYVVETMQAVLQAFFSTTSFEACLIDVVNRGGDADTTGAIAGMLAGARYGLAAIPARWRKALDGEIHTRCIAQAGALLALAQRAG